MSAARARVLISGHVQGVGFRWSTERMAREVGVAGWARNRRDGRVEAVFEGEQAAVDRAVEWCRRGPRGARVDGLELSWESPSGEDGFRIAPTA